jgi:hypothetical protein
MGNGNWEMDHGSWMMVGDEEILDIRYSILENRGAGMVNGSWFMEDGQREKM